MARVVVAMSGGVDSSVAALLLKKQGHEAIGVSMQLYDAAAGANGRFDSCCSLDDFADARRVCHKLDMPFYLVNYEAEFRARVIEPFVSEYRAGRTPNPCALCNQWLKFDRLMAHGRALGADFVATGHYARIVHGGAGPSLHKAVDGAKDQSYFLFGTARGDLGQVLFPLGDLTKSEVRELAREAGLRTADKPESQEICFVPGNDYAAFVAGQGGPLPSGEIVGSDGAVLGRHEGIHNYTVGQRKGLGLAAPEPMYVRAIDAVRNRVEVAPRAGLSARGLVATRVNWLADAGPCDITVKIRYRHPGLAARLTPLAGNAARVEFTGGGEAVTPGQAAVFYDGDRVLGGGWIDSPLKDAA